jgi:hypothetical protein
MPVKVRYTRELLAETAARSRSINEMMRRLGVPMAGGTHSYLSKRLKHYGIDTSHFTHQAQRPVYERHSYTRDALAEAAANSSSIGEMMDYLGVARYDSAYGHLRRRLDHFGINTSHFRKRRSLSSQLPEAKLAPAVARQKSIAGVLRDLGLPDSTTTRRLVKGGIEEYGLDTSHFTGQLYSKGRKLGPRLRPEELLVRLPAGAPRVPGDRLRDMLLHIGRPNECAMCGIGPEWRGRPMTLELDHVDGDWLNNTPENLRLLCPNCHAITPTYCGRNKRLVRELPRQRSGEPR